MDRSSRDRTCDPYLDLGKKRRMSKNTPTLKPPLSLLKSVELFNLRRKHTSSGFYVHLHCSTVTINSHAGLSVLLHQQVRI
jgi:hypothetical protein